MGKAEKGTPKAIANAMKAKGLGKLKWYCQVCEKQCRDDNGFKQHTMSEGHLRAMITVGDSANKTIQGYSGQFQSEFIQLLSRRWGTKRTLANKVYQEYIQDKNHLHMNATRWVTLTEFVKHLGRSGIVHVDENEKGIFISWIDNSPQALARQAASQAKDRADMDDEQRERKALAEQIRKAQELAAAQQQQSSSSSQAASAEPSAADEEAQSQPPKPVSMAPISISFGPKLSSKATEDTAETKSAAHEPEASTSASPDVGSQQPEGSTSAGSVAPPLASTSSAVGGSAPSVGGFKMGGTAFKKPNALKTGGNALKAASSASKEKDKERRAVSSGGHSMSAAEQLMAEDLERKRRMAEREDRDRKRVRRD